MIVMEIPVEAFSHLLHASCCRYAFHLHLMSFFMVASFVFRLILADLLEELSKAFWIGLSNQTGYVRS